MSNQSIRTGRVFARARPSMPFASCGHARACRLNNSSISWIILLTCARRRLLSSAPLHSAWSHSSPNLDSSEPVLVQIVSIRNLERQRGIAIAFPTTAKVQGLVNAADFVVTADAQCDGVVFAIADIRKSNTAQDGCIERSWRAKTIDTECIVSSVFATPLAVID